MTDLVEGGMYVSHRRNRAFIASQNFGDWHLYQVEEGYLTHTPEVWRPQDLVLVWKPGDEIAATATHTHVFHMPEYMQATAHAEHPCETDPLIKDGHEH